MAKDIVMTGTALVTFRKVIKGVPEDEVQDCLGMSEMDAACNIDTFDLQDITGLESYHIESLEPRS